MIKIEQLAGIVLCGGKSRRMGQEKYRLSFLGETLLQRICRIVQPEVSRILIVAALDQEIPQSGSNIDVLRDEIPDGGPLAVQDSNSAYSLCAIYRATGANTAARLIASGERRAAALPENIRTCWVPLDAIRAVDPDLESFWNCNTPQDYEKAIRRLL